ncbi:tetratricopeptide repeat protein [Porphyrobacter sp. YT40]|uniref:tetratricopeptide repeat protein n=1 Tax=Porphyrobacter sp. YT40 TaxID=2547601 RepID=UPI0011426F00|nr:tetratricopeptide repeat protein [Porphyrobacter sp. YT40]QDH35393.1 tetratricopeptide repeat protein [Porphyrobacter sp. YT40]
MARTPTIPTPTPSAEDEVLIREIDEAVREDALYSFMRDHGMKVLGVILLGVAGLGGWLIYNHYAEQALEQQSEALVSALDYAQQRDFDTASKKVAPLLGADASPGARAAARFIQAGGLIEQNNTAGAANLYKMVADDAEAPAALRDLARIREVTLKYDQMQPADVIAQLGPLAKPGNPFFGSAGELVAMAHLEKGDRKAAGMIFADIAKQEDLPETLRSRARQMAGLMGVDAVVDVNQLLKDEGVTTSDDAQATGAPAAAEVR